MSRLATWIGLGGGMYSREGVGAVWQGKDQKWFGQRTTEKAFIGPFASSHEAKAAVERTAR